jgi:hypothetical protein
VLTLVKQGNMQGPVVGYKYSTIKKILKEPKPKSNTKPKPKPKPK